MTEVRDRAIKRVSMILEGTLKGNEAQVLHREFQPLAENTELALRLAGEAIDTALHDLLVLLEQSQNIQVRVDDGASCIELREASDGLAGELYGAKGWFEKFSKAGVNMR